MAWITHSHSLLTDCLFDAADLVMIGPFFVLVPFLDFLPNLLASYQLPIGEFFPFLDFLPNPLASYQLPIGEFFPFLHFLPILLSSYQLPIGEFFPFLHFLPILLASLNLPVGVNSLFWKNSPNSRIYFLRT